MATPDESRPDHSSSSNSNPAQESYEETPNAKVSIKPAQRVLRGDTVTLRCDIDGEGVTSWLYSWYKDGAFYSSSELQEHTFSPVTESDAETPNAKVSIKPAQRVFRGDTVILRCDIDGEGVTSWLYSWYKDGAFYSSSELQEHKFSPVTESDAAKYSCYGAERGGSRTSFMSDGVTLTVSGYPLHVPDNDGRLQTAKGPTAPHHDLCGLLDIAREAWEQPPAVHRTTIEHVREMRERIDRAMPIVRKHLVKAQQAQQRHYNRAAQPREFQRGDHVLVLVPTAACKSLATWQGPYTVTEKRSYHVLEARRHSIEDEVQEMLRLGVIEPSRSPWSFPSAYTGAPATFQRLMDVLLRPHQADAAAYLDDVIIHLETWEDHLERLRRVLTELRWAGLTANPRKCHLAIAEAKYLGYQVGRGLIKPQEKKVAAILSMPRPTSKTQAMVEREALAIKWAVLELRYYLLGRHFTMVMDHAPLQWMAQTPKPKVSIKPAQRVFRGDTVTLRCDIDGEGVTSWLYSWYKDGAFYSSSELQEHKFSPVTESDAAKYSCYGAERGGSRSSLMSDGVTLTVSDVSPRVSLIISPSRTQHFTSVSLSLSCEDQSNSDRWRVRRYTESEQLEDCSSSVWGSQTGSTCTINSTNTSDTGVYWCQAESGENYHPVNITVHSGVILESPVHPVTEGDTLTLRCLYQHSTPPNLRADFYKDGSLIQNQTTEMIISTVSKSHEGFYYCKHSERGESPKSWISVRVFHSESQISVLHTVSSVLVVCSYLLVTVVLIFKCCRMRGETSD
ncbi:uncharacterized protein LOC132149742 [Carassius carassius]|uniref:uncharacterized protein LOC132149742 n=1 Tax=Carassius carassius TaxID=217509 RepID=UPI0028684E52|nr:uncharacterized protein LOC132149742 [Carassius carassius]